MPKLRQSLKMRWPTLIPLFLLIGILVSGRTPYLAAFVGITSCAIVGLTTSVRGNRAHNWALMVALHLALMGIAFTDFDERIKLSIFSVAVVATVVLMRVLRIRGRIEPAVLVEAFETGAKYALAVGAAAATVGIVIGVVTLTGVGFKISFIITGAATSIANALSMIVPSYLIAFQSLTLLAALVMTASVCILMGAGIPTTANYIIMVTVAAPTLVQLGWSRWWRTFSSFITGAGRHHAAGGAGGLRRRRHGGQRPVQDRQHGIPAGHRESAGPLRVCVFSIADPGGQGLYLV